MLPPFKSRRTFLKQAAVGVAAGTTFAPASRSALGANERVVTALIGCGGRGEGFLKHVDFVCDPDQQRLGQARDQRQLPSDHAVTDLRKILDNRHIDAVIIATPDHWHAPAAILACQAGKHVYVEKPWSHNFRESQMLVQAAKKHQRVVQHGTQSRSNPFVRDAIQMLREGIIGDVLIAKAWNIQYRENIGRRQPSTPPATLDYDTWVGPAEFMPFQDNRFHYTWHWWHNFGTGDIGNDGTHEIDYARWGLGVDSLPTQVSALGGKFYHDDDQQFPDTATCLFEFPGDGRVGNRRQLIFEMRIWSTNYPHQCDSGVEFLGTQGKMILSKRGKLEIWGERNQPIPQPNRPAQEAFDHVQDFYDAIRQDRLPHANIHEAHQSVALVHLANLSLRLGRSVEINPQTEEIAGDPAANQLLGRVYRQEGHWAVPHG